MAETQISAFISDSTKDEVERYVLAHGVKKAHVVEEALLHHMRALRELPSDVILPSRLVVSDRSFDEVARLIETPRAPTKAMRALMGEERSRKRAGRK